jgi:hypothetical protein
MAMEPSMPERDPTAISRRKERSRRPRGLAVAAVLALAGSVVAGCGGGGDDDAAPEGRVTVTTSPETTMSDTNPPFEVHEWTLPPSVEVVPQQMTPQDCADHYRNVDGRRQELAHEDPPVVTVKAGCGDPLTQEESSGHKAPDFDSPHAMIMIDGNQLGIECHTIGQDVPDSRNEGAETSSDVWLGVVNALGQAGFYPHANVGYVSLDGIDEC